MAYALSESVAAKVLEVVDQGLTSGLGVNKPGSMCVEAAVCFALGLPHGDNPPCVGAAVRSAKIRLNDSLWSSDQARAKGMRRVAIAQLGSDKLDQREFAKRLSVEIIRQIVPIALRAAASLQKDEKHKAALEDAAKLCETEPTRASALAGKKAAATSASADAAYAAYASDDAAAAATSAAADAAYAAYASDDAAYASAASAAAASAASADAAYAAAAYASAASAAAASAAAAAYASAKKSKPRDEILSRAAEIMVGILKDMGSEGCQWLSLTEPA